MRTLLITALLPLAVAQGQPWILENASLRVTVQPTGAFALHDKATGRDWLPDAAAGRAGKLSRTTASAAGRRLQASAEFAGARLNLVFELPASIPELRIRISAGARDPIPAALEYPFALEPPDVGYRLVLPHKTGLMFSLADVLTLFDSMPGSKRVTPTRYELVRSDFRPDRDLRLLVLQRTE